MFYSFSFPTPKILRKLHREMSMASGTECILEKADIALALFRDIGAVPARGRQYSSPGLWFFV